MCTGDTVQLMKFLTDAMLLQQITSQWPPFILWQWQMVLPRSPSYLIAFLLWQLSFPCYIHFQGLVAVPALSVIISHSVSQGQVLPWNAISISHPALFQTKSFSTLSFLPLMFNMPDQFIHLLHSLLKLLVVTSEGSLGWVCWDCACDLCIVCQSTSVYQHIWRLCTLKEHLKMSLAIKDSSS